MTLPKKYKKIYENGYDARMCNQDISSNPYKYIADVVASSWWESGWQKADRDKCGKLTK